MTVAERIVEFLDAIGVRVEARPIDGPTTLPGIAVERGALVVDWSRLLQPGDLLHEAGHLAVLTGQDRADASGDFGDGGGAEMASIAWSYAAAIHIGLDPAVVFHPDGYRGGSASLLENFASGRTIGVPLLEWYGLTVDYPAMTKWLRD
jgi:hypothetical protein